MENYIVTIQTKDNNSSTYYANEKSVLLALYKLHNRSNSIYKIQKGEQISFQHPASQSTLVYRLENENDVLEEYGSIQELDEIVTELSNMKLPNPFKLCCDNPIMCHYNLKHNPAPIETTDELNDAIKQLLWYIPGISKSSMQSPKNELLSSAAQSTNVFNDLLSLMNMKSEDILFVDSSEDMRKPFDYIQFYTESACCMSCQKMVLLNNTYNSKTECLLTHLRNVIAHGSFNILKGGMLVGVDHDMSGNVSAFIKIFPTNLLSALQKITSEYMNSYDNKPVYIRCENPYDFLDFAKFFSKNDLLRATGWNELASEKIIGEWDFDLGDPIVYKNKAIELREERTTVLRQLVEELESGEAIVVNYENTLTEYRLILPNELSKIKELNLLEDDNPNPKYICISRGNFLYLPTYEQLISDLEKKVFKYENNNQKVKEIVAQYIADIENGSTIEFEGAITTEYRIATDAEISQKEDDEPNRIAGLEHVLEDWKDVMRRLDKVRSEREARESVEVLSNFKEYKFTPYQEIKKCLESHGYVRLPQIERDFLFDSCFEKNGRKFYLYFTRFFKKWDNFKSSFRKKDAESYLLKSIPKPQGENDVIVLIFDRINPTPEAQKWLKENTKVRILGKDMLSDLITNGKNVLNEF